MGTREDCQWTSIQWTSWQQKLASSPQPVWFKIQPSVLKVNYLMGRFFHIFLLNIWECIREPIHGGWCYCRAMHGLILLIKKVNFPKRKWAEECFIAPSNWENTVKKSVRMTKILYTTENMNSDIDGKIVWDWWVCVITRQHKMK